ncbi:uncharacterized protein LOC127242156 isoform X2 [Andrographis paniculata]|uniref:uncharacterized protein LOC127242156 isoform X1 n=1 Tax=Andrographis paniculata TaxID=175694 RepID=UPI0021E71FCF|nr:uncharacterized protein LOC127242156 isoform X1 [Andrographis paniculata]XP_051117538.1 uncharacterized protein LOC127242156 isoform X2 [Andrographis paniculata]
MSAKHNHNISPAPLLLILLLLIGAAGSDATGFLGGGGGGGYFRSRISVPEVEFLMESEVSRRFLQQVQRKSVVSLNPTKEFCSRNIYGSCISAPNVDSKKRKCDYANSCGDRGRH